MRHFSASTSQAQKIWFHAASAGELESLWEVAKLAGASGVHLWLSVFSSSALDSLDRLAAELKAAGASLQYAGLSPREGFWGDVLSRSCPDVFVTVKYEAWPELWAELTERKIPLAIVGAMSRKSLKIAKASCRLLSGGLPSLHLFTFDHYAEKPLSKLFPTANQVHTGDPRWDRIALRKSVGNERARTLIQFAQGLPRPWGIMGSVWLEDLQRWEKALDSMKGILWVVPHRIDAEFIGPIERFFEKRGWRVIRSSEDWKPVKQGLIQPRVVLVDEMGFLSELYQGGDWAFVGGGFSKGVHNTMEPALVGIPVSAGPRGSDRFAEISILAAEGQLTLVENEKAIAQWFSKNAESSEEQKRIWLQGKEGHLGATHRVWNQIHELLTHTVGKEV